MSAPKVIIIKESFKELNFLLKKSKKLIFPRLRMLIEIKKHENEGISKRTLSELIGVSHNSVQTWRTLYEKGGIQAIMSHKKTGFKKPVFTEEQHNIIKNKLHDPINGLRGYKELLAWVEEEFKKEYKYNTLLKYCIREFGSSVKVARKSHIKKDNDAVEAFKKTSFYSAKK